MAKFISVFILSWMFQRFRSQPLNLLTGSLIEREVPTVRRIMARYEYDVFLSFRGEDTRKGFTDHLYTALVRQGIHTFRDDEELEKGQPISSKLLQAIQDSRIALVVFSRNYASSRWCLDELAKIVGCRKEMGQKVFPIFYHVDPSEVRKQTGSFGHAFDAHEQSFKDGLEKLEQDRSTMHFLLGPKDRERIDAQEECFKGGLEKVQKWRAALIEVANLSGFHLQDRHESEFIEEIIESIRDELFARLSPFSKDLGLVGIGSRLEEIMELCSGTIKDNNVHFIGISGMGGIGKTTLARAFFDEICHKFEAKSFLENVREVSKRDGMAALQKKLLSDLQVKSNAKKKDVHKGSSEMKHRIRYKKVLIILDDVDELKQLEALAGSHNWFGQGSRIIITTRDEQLLISHGVVRIYKAKELKYDEALQLFSWKAFKNDYPPKDYMKLSHDFVTYAKGLPLAIEVLGPFLCGKSVREWESALIRLKENLEGKIMSALLIGFDGLHEKEKQIFLHIACFFKGHDKDHVTEILESLGFDPIIGICDLIRKSLITEVGSKIWMHDLLQEMGWEFVRQECPDEPGKRSKLWHSADVLDVMTNDKGTDAVHGMVLSLPQEELNSDAFLKMKNLRFLKISDVLLPEGLNYMSTELVVIEWHGYPSELLPEHFPSKKLVQLNMCGSHIKHLWKGPKVLNKLKFIELNDSESLIETPDFTEVPNLERLILEGCTKLSKVHSSISILKRLILLNMKNCTSLEILPRDISLESLEIFNLSGCARLKRFPKIVGDMECLSKLYLDGTAIESLPVSIKRLTGLTLLDLTGCKNLLRLPSVISSLRKLKKFILSDCTNLGEIPENLGGVEYLEELDISGTAIHQMPLSIVYNKNLKVLSCSNCQGQLSKSLLFPSFCSLTQLNLGYCNLFDGAIPNDLDHLSSLESLFLSGNNFTNLPESISLLSKLETLALTHCSQLQSLPKLPFSIRWVSVLNCTSLKSDSDQYEVWPAGEELGLVKRSISPRCLIEISGSQFVAWLQRYHEVEIVSQPLRMVHGLSAWSTEIPGWFSNQNDSFFVTISLPNEIGSWIGCALSVGLVIHQDFDISRDLKVMHEFDCYFYTKGRLNKQTLLHEINVKDVPFTGPIMYWISIPYLWFSERCNAFNECTSIRAYTIIDSPYVKVEISGNRLLYNLQDFIEFTQAIISHGWAIRIRKKEKNNSGQLIKTATTEQERQVASQNSGSSKSITSLLESLPSDLECYQCQGKWGGKKYIIEGKLKHPRTASILGEILEEYSIQNDLYYGETFPQTEIPEWFCSVNGSLATFPLYSSFDTMKGWKGIAVCAAFSVNRHYPSLILENLDPENPFINYASGNFTWRIVLTTPILEILTSLKGSGFIWIAYVSRGSFSKDALLNECTPMNIQCDGNNKDVTVHSCGYQVIFDQNMQELIETIVQCSTASEYQLSKNIKTRQSVAYYDDDDDDDDDDNDNDDDDNTP